MKSRFVQVLLLGMALALPIAAKAATHTLAIGTHTFLGQSYNVSLLYGDSTAEQTFNNLAPSITFTTAEDAWDVGAELKLWKGNSFDFSPGTSFDGGRIVFAATSTDYQYITIGSFGEAPFSGRGNFFTQENTGENFFSFVQFERAAPVPEPETYAMMLAGLGLLGIAARRRKQAIAV